MSANDRHDGFAPEFAEVESIVRSLGTEPARLEPPPDDLWGRIAAEVDLPTAELHDRAEPAPPSSAPRDGADVVPISQARRTRIAGIVGAAAAAVVLVIAGVVVFTGDSDADPVVAQAELTFDEQDFDPLGADAAAGAELVEHGDGSFELRLVNTDLPVPLAGREDLELWLIEPDDAANPVDLVSLGLVDPDDPGVFQIPAGYDPATFFVVDISVEPRDGEPTHSGRSILRGPLEIT